MQEDNSYIRDILENLNKQFDSIDQKIQKLTILNTIKLQGYINDFRKELNLILKENEKVVSDKGNQNIVSEQKAIQEDTIQKEEPVVETGQQVVPPAPVQTTVPPNDQNYILKDIRSKLKNLDDIIKKAKETRKEDDAKSQDNISQEAPDNKIKDQDYAFQDISTNENTLRNQELPCDVKTKEVSPSSEKKSNVNDGGTVEKEESNIVTIGKFDELIRVEPTNFKHYMERANLYIKRKDYDKAESDYKKAQELTQSKDISVLLALANLYNLNGNSKKILPLYNQAFELNPSNVDVLQQRARYYLILRKDDEFLKDIEKAISLDENNAKSYAIRAEYNASKEYYHRAFDDVNKVIRLRPDNISARYFRGVMLYNLEKYNECFDDMKQILESNTNENEIYKYIGVCSFKLNKFEEAREYLTKAVDVGVQDEIVFYYKAQVEYEIGDFDASLRDISKVMDMNSKEYKYYLLRARVCDKKEFFDQAYKDYEKAYKLESTLNVLIEKADFLIKHEKYKQALKDYTLAISLDATKANFYKQRSYIYEKLGKSDKAKIDLEKALSINPALIKSETSFVNKHQTQKKEQKTKVQTYAVDPKLEQQWPQEEHKSTAETEIIATDSRSQQPVESNLEHKFKSSSEIMELTSQVLPETPNLISKQEQVLQEQNIVEAQTSENEVKQELPEQKAIQEDNIPTPTSGLSVDVLFNRANINYKNKKFDIALQDIEDIISQNQGYVKAYILKADICHQLQDTDKELQALSKSIELAPSLFLSYLKRAEIYVLQNKEDLAFSDFSKALELNPKNGGVYIGLARIYAKRGQKDKALENYNNARKCDLKYIKIVENEIKTLS
jgi:tetratricopeptide (TPR) repeat protein